MSQETEKFYDLEAIKASGENVAFSDLKGKVVLVVNTASKCGFTPQYKGLEDLYKKYKNQGLVILGFPCDQFAHQEPGSDAEISQFCSLNYGVTFPIMKKSNVNGPDTHPVFRYLKERSKSLFGNAIKWNFTKFLISPDGKKIQRFSPTTEPIKLESYITKALSA